MDDPKTHEKYRRRRKVSLNSTFLVLGSYLTTLIVTLIAKRMGASSITYTQLGVISGTSIIITTGFLVLLFFRQTMSLRFANTIYFSQFGVWLILYGIWVCYINEARVVGLILANLALGFLLSTASLGSALVISGVVLLLYGFGTYWGIYHMGQPGKLSTEFFYLGCFVPSALLISYMAGQFNKQRKDIKLANRSTEQSLGSLKEIILYIAKKCKSLTDASEDLLTLSTDMNGNIEGITSRTTQVTSASDNMSERINIVAKAINEASDNINLISSSAEEITATIQEISKNSEKAKDISNQAVTQSNLVSEKVKQLGKVAQEIGKITEVISEISEQTNLLALNATIEAARAGESGRGFAVVANEIKELARATADATHQIKQQINDIQNATSQSVAAIMQNVGVINNIDEIVSTINLAIEDQSSNTGEIAKNVAQSSQGISEVKESAIHTSSVAAEIAKALADVNQELVAMSGNSSHLNQSANSLKMLAKDLEDLTKEYSLD